MSTETTPKERIDELLENYLLALAGVDWCPDDAPAATRKALVKNADAADQALSAAIVNKLEKNGNDMEAAVKRLADANEASRDALHDSKQIAVILGLLQQATTLAISVLAVA